jgi:hypothetical protein
LHVVGTSQVDTLVMRCNESLVAGCRKMEVLLDVSKSKAAVLHVSSSMNILTLFIRIT